MKCNLFNIASLLTAAVMLFSCGDVNPDSTKDEEGNGENVETGGGQEEDLTQDLILTADKTVIHANGTDAVTFTVTLGDKVITEDVVFSDEEGNIVTGVSGMKFTTETTGEYHIRAEYKVKFSELITVRAVPVAVPESPADSDPSSTSFKQRVMLSYFTGTSCPACPRVKSLLKELSETAYADKYVCTVVHQYGADDPAWFEGNLPASMGVSDYPSVTFNLNPGSTDNTPTFQSLQKDIDAELEDGALAGVAASVVYAEGKVVVKALVKAAETGKYKVGAWLLEDGIEYPQNGGTQDYHGIHDQSLRIADSNPNGKLTSIDWSGHQLWTNERGEIEAGKTAEYVFVMDMKNTWAVENCHVAVFVSSQAGSTYYVNNVIDVDLNESVGFEYIK